MLGAVPVFARGADTGGERGSATVEAAIAVCAVVVVLAMALAGSAAVLAQLRCIDAAREAARLVARGEPERAEQAARAVAPTGARIAIRVQGDEAVVEVSAEPAGGVLPGLSVHAEALAVLEPGVAGAG
jgi:Flp pilus assembly protein TadG